jgi:hypothetical protein
MMRKSSIVSLIFTHEEVIEALRQWCEKNHPTIVENFSRRADIDWVHGARVGDVGLGLMFDGEIEEEIPREEPESGTESQ